MDLLTIGDSSIDLFMKVDEKDVASMVDNGGRAEICFYHGSKIPVSHFETSVAGNSVNVAIGCKYLGLQTAVYTELGDDENGNRVVSELNQLEIDTKFCVKNNDTPTNVHTLIVCGKDRTIFSYHEKRNYQIRDWGQPKWIYYTSLPSGFEKFQAELIDFIKDNKNIGIAFNPGTYQLKAGLQEMKNFLQVTDILFLNTDEAKRLVGNKGLAELHKLLHQQGVKTTVITDGENGASVSDGNEVTHVNSYNEGKPFIDKTGAGDAFSSGFLSAMFYGKNLKDALTWGVINAGKAVTEIGAIKRLCTKEEIENIAKKVCQ